MLCTKNKCVRDCKQNTTQKMKKSSMENFVFCAVENKLNPFLPKVSIRGIKGNIGKKRVNKAYTFSDLHLTINTLLHFEK